MMITPKTNTDPKNTQQYCPHEIEISALWGLGCWQNPISTIAGTGPDLQGVACDHSPPEKHTQCSFSLL